MKYLMMALLMLGAIACSDSNKNARLELYLTDAPGDFEEVLIDIQDVKINVSTEGDDNGWQSLSDFRSGVYNLLEFTNGIDTLIGQQELPAGKISQMRLVLGTDNHVKIDGERYALDTPSAQSSGLKFNIHATLEEGITYRLWIDFDASRSIVQKGNGGYALKPVIRTFTEATSGAIKGRISPADTKAYLMAISAAQDTFGTYADIVSGYFLIRGLEEGQYDVVIDPAAPYSKTTIEDVNVVLGAATDLGTIEME